MADWIERARQVNQLLQQQQAQQKAAEDQVAWNKISQEMQRTANWQSKWQSILANFNRLGIPQKLREINQQIYYGLGEVVTYGDYQKINRHDEITVREVTGISECLEFEMLDIYRIHEITLPIYSRRFGKYIKTIPDSDWSDTPHYGPSYKDAFGWHEELTREQTTGYEIWNNPTVSSIGVGLQSNLAKDTSGIGFGDEYGTIKLPAVRVPSTWKVEQRDISHGYINFPSNEFDTAFLGSIIDNCLAQSVASRLRDRNQWNEWIQKRREALDKIASINYRIGQVRPVDARKGWTYPYVAGTPFALSRMGQHPFFRY